MAGCCRGFRGGSRVPEFYEADLLAFGEEHTEREPSSPILLPELLGDVRSSLCVSR